MNRPPRVGLKLVPMWTTLAEVRQTWRTADEAGFDHAWTFDHLNPTEGGVEGPVFDGWSLLAAAAETTRRVRIGCMVTGNTYRNPGYLAKLATTVDHLSNGRLEFGIGAGWAEAEHTMLGLPFPSRGQRIRQMGEAVAIIRALWTGKPIDFDGRYYRINAAIQQPVPLQKPAPPVWIGGAGENLTLRIVAEHADVWNYARQDLEQAALLHRALDRHCADIGRDPAEIIRSAQLDHLGDADATLRRCEQLLGLGFEDLVIKIPTHEVERHATVVAEQLLPRLRTLGTTPAGRS